MPALATTCTAYGQGGARVTDPERHRPRPIGALTVPVVTQVANHLTRFGSFKSSDLILVYGGNNDVFIQFDAFAAAAAQIQANAAAGLITPDRANLELFNAQQVAQAAMKTAAQELATLIKTQILAKGGTYVAVMTLSDIADTPFGNSPEVAPARSVLTALSETFNLWLRDGLTGQPVQIIDTCALYKDGYANPAKYGIVNNTTPACDLAKIQAVTGGAVDRRLVAVLQCHAGRALQHPRHRRRRQHLAVRRRRPSDDRRPQDHQRCVRGPAARVRLDLTPTQRGDPP